MSQVMKEIEKQTRYLFINKGVDTGKKLSVNLTQKTIQEVLDYVLKNTDITYKIVKNHVVLTNKTMKDTELPSTNQNRKRLTGQVVGQDGEPLIGVNVVVKGTTIGSMTDMDGNYILENVPSNATVEFSYIGYLQQSINICLLYTSPSPRD